MQSEKSRIKGRKKRNIGISKSFIRKIFRTVTINVPHEFDDILKQFISKKHFPSKSEIIRRAIEDCLEKNRKIYKAIKRETRIKERMDEMKIITINLVDDDIKELDKMVKERILTISRSEFIRDAIKEFIMNNIELINPNVFKEPIDEEKLPFKIIKKLEYEPPAFEKTPLDWEAETRAIDNTEPSRVVDERRDIF